MRRLRRPGAAARKSAHVEACLRHPVEYRTRTTGFERLDLPYCALPDSDLARIDMSALLLGRRLRAPFLIGAMTGGGRHSERINRNLAAAAQRLGVGMMLGSQRIMLEEPAALPSFQVRPYAPDVLLLGNLGVAQLNRGFGATEVERAIALVGADGLALHANPLQEALQADGDGDFRGLAERIGDVAAAVERPLLLKEVGHGLGADVVRAVAGSGLAGLDVAGAGGTSWARVEQYVRHGTIVHPELAEWGIPTADALAAARLEAPGLTLIASGGIRSGVDAAKALALGADAVAVALPLLRPALESADAVCETLGRLVDELRVAMHCTGARTLDDLRGLELAEAPAPVPA
ncbi:MAG TPA: type 2 isopentenyl-diphosphate Delta-isomerase [Gaiellaceae bacterium]|nr:type 2 isopentenyl-diphosphate Delta-isomerase [Gaiellaceae bacterium]